MTRSINLPPGMSLVAHQSLPSTNAEAKRIAIEDGAAEGTIIWSRLQTAGKGRQNRPWISPRGNLYSSVILRPIANLEIAAQSSFLPALAVADSLSEFTTGCDVTFKWPNDVLLGGKKVSGILLECGSWASEDDQWLVLGCGINLTYAPPDTRLPATSVQEHTGFAPNVEDALESYYCHYFNWLRRWQKDGFDPIREAWLKMATGIGKIITVDIAGQIIEGIFKGLTSRGGLEVENDNGVHVVSAGEVYFRSKEGLG